MIFSGLLLREKRQYLPSKIAPHVHASGCKMRSISAGKALFFSEQELAPNPWVDGANPYSSRQFLPYVLAAKTRGPLHGADEPDPIANCCYGHRVHRAIARGLTPARRAGARGSAPDTVGRYGCQHHCQGLVESRSLLDYDLATESPCQRASELQREAGSRSSRGCRPWVQSSPTR
jgi:hypothetical protein